MAIYRNAAGEALVTGWCRRRLDAWPVEHSTRMLDSALGPTHALTTGHGERTVVVLPGTTFCSATMTGFVGRLAMDSRVVILDLPGQPGLSNPARPTGDRTLRYGAWLDELLPQLGTEPVHLLGHSLGAAIALATTPSSQIAGLWLVNPAGLIGAKLTPSLLVSTVPWLLRPTEPRTARLLRYMLAPGHQPPAEFVEWLTLVSRHTRFTGAPDPLSADLLGRWRSTPVTIVAGRYDRFFPSAQLATAAQAALGVAPHVIEDAGHLAPDEQPEKLLTLLTGP